jgi:hypothetical protein
MGVDLTSERLARLVRLGLAVEMADGTVELPHPSLVRSGFQLAALGIDMDAVLSAQTELTRHAQAMAQVCVDLFRDSVWQPFVAANAPEDGWPAVREALDRSLPVASQAVLVTFRQALADAIAEALLAARSTDATDPDQAG